MMGPEQERVWRRLTANQRRILLSHRPDELERDEVMRREIWRALESRLGARLWSASVAEQAEALEDEGQRRKDPFFAMELGEIGDALGLSKERVRQLIQRALEKLRANLESRSALEQLLDDTPPLVLGGGRR